MGMASLQRRGVATQIVVVTMMERWLGGAGIVIDMNGG